ncbi:MFS transporter [Pseudomonas sp. GNP013]
MFLAFAGSASRLSRIIVLGTVVCAVSLCAMAANPPLGFTLAALAGLGFGITVSNVSSNMTLQGAAPEALRGRVIAFYIAMRFGFDAIGGLLAGLLAAALNVQWTLLVAGVLLGAYQICSGLLHKRAEKGRR